MKKRIQKMMKNEKGLTLVELLAVIVILGIIAAIAVPSIGKIIENTKYNAVKADAISALNAGSLYFAENIVDANGNEVKVVTVEDLEKGGYLESVGKLTGATTAVTQGDGPLTIAGTSAKYSGDKTVKFNDVKITDINADIQKGSAKESKNIDVKTVAP